jgi:RNA polymerase sigma-70 factor (ECF subfamily)
MPDLVRLIDVRIGDCRTLPGVSLAPQDALRAARLRELFAGHSRQVFGYALRQLAGPDGVDVATAQDVVAEVFLIAWRRIDAIPDHGLPWLLVTARHVLANTQRATTRRWRLAHALAGVDRLTAPSPGAEETALARAEMLAALEQLSTAEREAVLLVAWDGLSSSDAAMVAGCSPHAFEVRLSRARARLNRILSAPSQLPSFANEVLS